MNNELLLRSSSDKAMEFESVYKLPERQKDISVLRKVLSNIFRNKNVLEIACGTGFWTQYIANSAKSIHGIDSNEELLHLAFKKEYNLCPVIIEKSDVFSLMDSNKIYNGAFCGFYWSQIPNLSIKSFLNAFHKNLQKGSIVIFVDDYFVKQSSRPMLKTDNLGMTNLNVYPPNGANYEIIDNYPSESELKSYLSNYATKIIYTKLNYYWILVYYLK